MIMVCSVCVCVCVCAHMCVHACVLRVGYRVVLFFPCFIMVRIRSDQISHSVVSDSATS